MSFFTLPVELQLQILDCLGPEFFREDAGRLALSKAWYGMAFPIFASHLYLTNETLGNLVGQGDSYKRVFRVRPFISTVEFQLQFPATELNDNLERLEWPLRRLLWRPWHLVLRSLPANLQWVHNATTPYLKLANVEDLLLLEHLTSLDLDMAGVKSMDKRYRNFGREGGWKEVHAHLCETIGRLLPSLRRLHCRMNMMCPALLMAPKQDLPSDSESQGLPDLDLEDVIINMSIADWRTNLPSAIADDGLDDLAVPAVADDNLDNLAVPAVADDDLDDDLADDDSDDSADTDPFLGHYHATSCIRTYTITDAAKVAAMEEAATELARRMRHPRMVRVISLTGTYPNFGRRAFDALTGQHFALEYGAPWDADGTAVKEP